MTIHAALKECQGMLDIQRRDQPRHTQYQANPKLRVRERERERERERDEDRGERRDRTQSLKSVSQTLQALTREWLVSM